MLVNFRYSVKVYPFCVKWFLLLDRFVDTRAKLRKSRVQLPQLDAYFPLDIAVAQSGTLTVLSCPETNFK